MRLHLLCAAAPLILSAYFFGAGVADGAASCTLTATPNTIHISDPVTLTLTPFGNVQFGFIDNTPVSFPGGTRVLTATALGTFAAHGMVLSDSREFFCDTSYTVAAVELATLTGDVVSATTAQKLANVTVELAQGGFT